MPTGLKTQVISRSVLNFSLSTLHIVFRILYLLLWLCFAEIQTTSQEGPPENNITPPETSNTNRDVMEIDSTLDSD